MVAMYNVPSNFLICLITSFYLILHEIASVVQSQILLPWEQGLKGEGGLCLSNEAFSYFVALVDSSLPCVPVGLHTKQ